MIQPRLLHGFKPKKNISAPLLHQQGTACSFSSTSGLCKRLRSSTTKQSWRGPIVRKNPVYTIQAQATIQCKATNHRIAALNASMLDKEPKKPGWKHDRPPKDGLRGMDGHKRFLYWKTSICYKNGNVQTAETIEKEKPAQAAAAKFFQHPPELLYSAASYSHHPENDHIPEIVVIGASNAGKSTFLNALLGGIEMAKASPRPGKTTTMNAYGVGPRPKIAPELIRKGDAPPKHSLILMDTPGYGHKSKASWGETIVQYLIHRKMLRGAVILIPAEKDSVGMDRWMLKTLAQTLTPTLVVITKADKCGETWPTECLFLSQRIEDELERLKLVKWRNGSDRTMSVYATAAGMDTTRRLGNGAGMGGVRLAILELAGYDIKGRVEQQPETKSYTGKVVSFDDIVWKA